MIELERVYIDKTAFRLDGETASRTTGKVLKRYITDLAKEVERTAKIRAPKGKGYAEGGNPKPYTPGTLKRIGIIREPTRSSTIPGDPGDEGRSGEHVTGVHAIGGGFSVRGGKFRNKGQFSAASLTREPGYVFKGFGYNTSHYYSAQVLLNPAVPHAKWVHEGTGRYGPEGRDIVSPAGRHMRFRYRGRWQAEKSVSGQRPQPFLTEAYEYVNDVYAPAKLSELRAVLAAEL